MQDIQTACKKAHHITTCAPATQKGIENAAPIRLLAARADTVHVAMVAFLHKHSRKASKKVHVRLL